MNPFQSVPIRYGMTPQFNASGAFSRLNPALPVSDSGEELLPRMGEEPVPRTYFCRVIAAV